MLASRLATMAIIFSTLSAPARAAGEVVNIPILVPLTGFLSLEGASLAPDPDTNRELYGHDVTNREILTGDFKTPAAAAKFERALHRDSAHRN